ncbi:TPA: hypothetical protein I7730_00410 [Vibrio vulnificus]|uniref:Uncharacterized protein n=1 Tax=Vibrio vulnificus TaxID=672 RepID=A0A8H9MY38_VIBVL|nr:hypothetical protein [Vibrio vulnificus]
MDIIPKLSFGYGDSVYVDLIVERRFTGTIIAKFMERTSPTRIRVLHDGRFKNFSINNVREIPKAKK